MASTSNGSNLAHHADIDRMVSVSQKLGCALSGFIGTIAQEPFRPHDLVRCLGAKKDLASRLVTAVSTSDPLAALYYMPGPVPLRGLVRSSRDRGIPEDVLRSADEAIDEFEKLLREHAGDKTGLNALISTFLPEAHEEANVTARQLVYRGVSLVKGLAAEIALISFLVHRSSTDPERCDTAMIGGWIGLRRIKPRAPMRFIARRVLSKESPQRMFDSCENPFYDEFMKKFSDQPLPVSVRQVTDRREYWLDDRGVGPQSSVKVFLTELYRGNHPLVLSPTLDQPRRFFFSGIDVPTKSLVLDLLIADDVWPGLEPKLRVYETAANGIADPNDATREYDIMSPPTQIQSLGCGFERFREPRLPNYPGMLQEVAREHGWSATLFRGYRCQIDYPMYSSQVTVVVDPGE